MLAGHLSLAGWLGTTVGIDATFMILACIAAAAVAAAVIVWPASDPEVMDHAHHDLPEDDPHWDQGSNRSGRRHSHAYVIDELHPDWPRQP
jgi:hypothetical protein